MKINTIKQEYLLKKGQEITINELSQKLNISKEEIAVAIDSSRGVESIYKENSSDDDRTIENRLISEDDESEKITNKLALKQLIENLEDREKEIIYLRYYKDKTQTQVAKILGITQVQVSRIEKKILTGMKTKLAV